MTGEAQEPATVLVVEDTRVNRLALRRGVEQEGHRVVEAADGREALDVLVREKIDMVLLDLVMPELDGFGVLDRMAGDADLRDIPVLVISAIDATEDVARAIEMGAIDCLPKPFEPVMLRVRLRTTLEQARLRRLEQAYLRQELALRQQERLATLGRLSAGLGHELNNPAAAALSTARQLAATLQESEELLRRILARADGLALVEAVDQLRAAHRPPASPGERDGMAAALEPALERLRVPEPWNEAPDLARSGLSREVVETHLAGLDDGAGLALAWWRARSRIRRSVDQIATSVERMAALTSALRGYSYLDRAPQQDVDVRRGLDDTLTILGHKMTDAVTVVRDYAADLPTITAFGGQLNQVWTNLLDNALDALGDSGTVTVRAFAAGDGVVAEVEDDGPGIAAELQGQVFDPFVTTKPPGQGTGLGLSISHQIVTEAHGGRLTVRSEPGRTVFRVELPATPPGGREHE